MLKFQTNSDRGGVLIGVDGFNVLIPNGYGDCSTRVFVCDKNDGLVPNDACFFTYICGDDISIFDDDCCDKYPVTKISGSFACYFKSFDEFGVVYLEKECRSL